MKPRVIYMGGKQKEIKEYAAARGLPLLALDNGELRGRHKSKPRDNVSLPDKPFSIFSIGETTER